MFRGIITRIVLALALVAGFGAAAEAAGFDPASLRP